jgi:hypothetical protein
MGESDEGDELGKLGGDPDAASAIRRWLGLAKEIVAGKGPRKTKPESGQDNSA